MFPALLIFPTYLFLPFLLHQTFSNLHPVSFFPPIALRPTIFHLFFPNLQLIFSSAIQACLFLLLKSTALLIGFHEPFFSSILHEKLPLQIFHQFDFFNFQKLSSCFYYLFTGQLLSIFLKDVDCRCSPYFLKSTPQHAFYYQ